MLWTVLGTQFSKTNDTSGIRLTENMNRSGQISPYLVGKETLAVSAKVSTLWLPFLISAHLNF